MITGEEFKNKIMFADASCHIHVAQSELDKCIKKIPVSELGTNTFSDLIKLKNLMDSMVEELEIRFDEKYRPEELKRIYKEQGLIKEENENE